MRWVFAVGRAWLPEGDPFDAGLGGTEQAVIHLTSALATLGHAVCVTGGVLTPRDLAGVQWLPAGAHAAGDICVAVNDARLLTNHSGLPVIWSHNEVAAWREIRKGRLAALWRHRPVAVFIGTVQARGASRLLPFRRRVVIPYGLPPAILAAAPATDTPAQIAVFTSQAYRGLREIIALWRAEISPHIAGARLVAYVGAGDVPAYAAMATNDTSITVRSRVGNTEMLDVLRSARVLLAPGHVSETFCLAAAEAIAMGVPVITRGTGSLRERVADGETGFICKEWRTMAARTREVLLDDRVWKQLHTQGLQTRVENSWRAKAALWEGLRGA